MSQFESASLAFVYFTASWCGPCKAVSPVFDQLKKQTSSAVFVKVDVDEDEQAVAKFSIESVPTLIVLEKGVVVQRTTPSPRTFESLVVQYTSSSST